MKTKAINIIVFCTIVMFLAIVQGQGGLVQASDATESNDSDVQSDLLTLSHAKQIALENSPTLASALERISQAREAVVQARADKLPTLSASAGWDYSEKTENSAPGYDETQYNARLTGTQVLFDGFYRKYSAFSAEYGEKMSLASCDETRNLLAWSVAQAFLNVQLARENVRIAESDMAFNQEQETEAVAKEKVGTGSYSDVLNFKSKVNSAKSSLLAARQDSSEAVHGLAALLGYEDACLPGGMHIAPLDMTDTETQHPDISQENLDAVLSKRPDLKAASLAVQGADAKVSMARAAYYPTVSLTGGYGGSSGDSLTDTDSMGAFLGISVSVDIFSGGARKSRVREALSQKKELQEDLTDARIRAVSDIRSSAENIATARQQLALQQENTTLIRTTRDLVEKEYNAGQVSLVRLNEAQNELVSGMGSLAIAKVSLVLALEAFAYYTGKNINLP